MIRIGTLVAGSAYPLDGFKLGLRDLGWREGENIRFELRAAEGELRQLPEFANQIVSAGVDAIAVIGAVTVRAVRQATSNIPIVFAVVVEPIGDGLADNLQRPGGNVTGVTTFDPEQARRQLQLLKTVSPGLERVAILSDRGVTECLSNSNRQAAQDLGLRAQVIRVEGPSPKYECLCRNGPRASRRAGRAGGAHQSTKQEDDCRSCCRARIADGIPDIDV
jgi:putative tryptophan/tyrosine transport system substrate-binding protein